MQNYNFVKNYIFVAKICKYALYESSEGLFFAPRKAANFCHPDSQRRQPPSFWYGMVWYGMVWYGIVSKVSMVVVAEQLYL